MYYRRLVCWSESCRFTTDHRWNVSAIFFFSIMADRKLSAILILPYKYILNNMIIFYGVIITQLNITLKLNLETRFFIKEW